MQDAAIAQAGTWGICGHDAIAHHVRKTIKYEKAVLQDHDPEALHQMRVGFRRLRSTLQLFDGAIALPKAAQMPQLRKVAKGLGVVRDLDVLKDLLETHYRPHLPPEEQQILDQVLRQLQGQRKRAFSALVKLLKGKVYQELKRAFKQWLKRPTYQERATFPLSLILPDLLLPSVGTLLLHRGWTVGDHRIGPKDALSQEATVYWEESSNGLGAAVDEAPDPSIKDLLQSQGECLHDLRKQVKRVRYQAEFFMDYYGPDYQQQVEEYRQIQDLLGQLQDCAVLENLLQKQLGKQWSHALPSLLARLDDLRVQIWRDWQPIQQRYSQTERRHRLRQLILYPAALSIPGHTAQESMLQA